MKQPLNDYDLLYEVAAQEYLDCRFSAGLVIKHPREQIYLRFERPAGTEELLVGLERHEALAVSFLLCQAVWSDSLRTDWGKSASREGDGR